MRKRVVFLAAIAVALVLLWPAECLTAKCDGKLLFAWPIRPGETFEVSFLHSLNLSPVTDVIEWTGSCLVVRKSVFATFGAGIPIPADGIGTELKSVGGHYELTGIDKQMESIPVMTQEVPNHRVAFGGREACLPELAGLGKSVDISVRRVPLIARLALLSHR
ncbi:MAG: DUF1850 domain-containing protein [Clostridiales bacterium]|nr:DUF1850 domain-containing protein [Clostridiales bacterium]